MAWLHESGTSVSAECVDGIPLVQENLFWSRMTAYLCQCYLWRFQIYDHVDFLHCVEGELRTVIQQNAENKKKKEAKPKQLARGEEL